MASDLPALQVDLTGLAQMMMTMGAGGLKKLASSGIDIHTVGSMYALGQLAPACQDFRNRLHKARKEQRKKQWWIGLVELGAGTNYVVDEFLKTRAGENVISLLTPIISVLDDQSSSTLMSSLFDHMKTPLEEIPGTGRLQAMRSVALPIARKLGFAERLAEIHRWLGSNRFRTQTGPVDLPLSDAVPATETAVAVITALKTLMVQSQEETKRLVFCGVRGAAWVLVYASLILGLGVCVVDKDGVPIPVTQPYSSAAVLIIPSKPNEVKLETLITSLDQLIEEPQSRSNILSMNWLVACDPEGCNIFSLLCGCDFTDHGQIGSLIFTLAMEYIQQYEDKLHRDGVEEGLPDVLVNGKSYQWCTTETSEQKGHRLRLILHRFGILGPFTKLDNVFTKYLRMIPNVELGEGQCVGYIEITDYLFHHLESLEIQHPIYQTGKRWMYSTAHHSKHRKGAWTSVIRTLSFVAALLSQSNWNEGSGKISYEALTKIAFGSSGFKGMSHKDWRLRNTSEGWLETLHYIKVIGDSVPEPDIDSEEEEDETQKLGTKYQWSLNIFEAYSTLFMGPELPPHYNRMKGEDTIGIEMDGILLLDSYMLETSLRHRPRYEIGQGSFALYGERRGMIRVGRLEVQNRTTAIKKSSSVNGARARDGQSNVFAAFSSSRVEIMASLALDAIILTFCLYAKGPDITIDGLEIDPTQISSNIRRTVVGLPCGHNTSAATTARQIRVTDRGSQSEGGDSWIDIQDLASWHICRDDFGEEWRISSIVPFMTPVSSSVSSIRFDKGLIAPMEGSPACQWAALSYDRERPTVPCRDDIVLQGQRCLKCITSDLDHARHECWDGKNLDQRCMIVMGDTT